MAKLTGPLLSMGARGQIGKTMVVGNWRGIDYARQYVVPANPRSTAQTANRTRFAFLREMYKLAPAAVRAPWEAFATGRPFIAVNKFVGENIRLIGSDVDLAAMIMSPGARGGLPPVSVVTTDAAAAGEVTVTIEAPAALPDGWAIVEAGAAAVVEQDANGLFSGPFVAATDAAAPYAIDLAGFTAGQTVRGFGWLVYSKANGDLAYSVSLSDDVVVA